MPAASRAYVCRFAAKVRKLSLLAILLTIGALASWGQVTVSPSSLTFSTTVLDSTSAGKSVTITNTGGSAQPVVITPSGDFTETDNCGGNIAAGANCTMNVFFAPTIVAAIQGAVTIADNSGNLLNFVQTSGKSVAPVTTSPTSLAFGTVTLGTTSATKSVKITSNIAGPVTISAITPSTDYSIPSTGTCLSTPLGKGQSCTFTVAVTPWQVTDNGSVIVTHNAPNQGPIVIPTTAASSASTPPLTLSKTSLTFKGFPGGTSAAQTVTITNNSGSSVTMGAIAVSGQYTITGNNCPASGSALANGANCSVSMAFAPIIVGKVPGSLEIAYSNPGTDSPQIVNLSGTSSAILTITTASFGNVGVGTVSAAKAVKITNNSASAVTLNSIVVSGDFLIQSTGTTCPVNGGTLNAGKNCTVETQFAPTIATTVKGALTVTNNASPNPLVGSLTGIGTNTASITPNPTSAHQGTSATIAISGSGTNFGPTTTFNFGTNITVGTPTINGPTAATVPITIAAAATAGSRTISATTGSQVANGTFTVVAGVPQITLISPNTIQPTQTESVNVTGAFTSWVSGTTKANFGPGISVGGAAAGTFGPVTVNNATSITASLKTSGASLGLRTVQVQTNAQTLTVENGMDVVTCPGSAPTVVTVSPAYGASGLPLNTQPQYQFSQPMNRSTFSLGNTGSVYFFDTATNVEVPGNISLDASGTIATIAPSVILAAGHTYYTYLSYSTPIQDTCGNNLSGQAFYYFQTAFSTDLTGPSLSGTSPENNDTNIALNAPVVLQFSNAIDPVTAQLGVSIATGGNPVPGNFTYSVDDKTVTFTPVNPLTASTSYTVSYSSAITDQTGNPLTNPGSFSFTTGTATDTTPPQLTLVDPPNGTYGVGTNVVPRIVFSKPVNELTIPPALALYYENGSLVIPGTVAVSADRMSATITPSAALQPNTYYGIYICGYADIAGNNGECSDTVFWTTTTGDTGHATVTSISPANGQTSAPTNTLVNVVMSDDIDPTTVSNSSIVVKTSGGSVVAGTVALASDGVTLTFTPSAALAASTLYNVTVSGFNDIEGNSVTSFSSSFTTGTLGYGNGSFTISSTNPANGAVGVAVNSKVTFTMTNLINAASVNTNSVQVYIYNTGFMLAGSYSISGNAVTFTPATPYPGNTQIGMYVYGLTDEAGNPAYQSAGFFATTNTPDTTTPTVTISPSNGSTNVGLNTQVVLTFSKSMNPSTINGATVALFNGDQAIAYGSTISQNNRTVVLNPNGTQWPSGATITVALNSGVQDLSGNALAPTTSTFTVTQALPGGAPYVTAMRPGNGATDVPGNTLVTLFTSVAMNPSTITSALHVVDNGVVVSGSVQLFSSGQAIQFTPGAPFGASDVVQVFLDSTAASSTGVPLQGFQGQFTVHGAPTTTAAQPVTMNPFPNATGVPLNTVMQVEYDQALQSSSITCNGSSGSVTLYQYSTGTYLSPTCTLSGTQVINIAPTSNLAASSQYLLCVSGAVTNTNGVAVQSMCASFNAGTATDTAAPTITSEAPTNNATGIGTNTIVSVNFNKAINPVSANGSTIQLSAGTTTEATSSIAFTPDYKRVSITPQAPLPVSTAMTVAISGVNSQAGKPVANTTTHFTTGAGPDFSQAYVVNSSVVSNQANVPVNSVFSMQFSKPMDIGSFNPNNTYVYDFTGGAIVPTTVSWSTDQTTVFLVPTSALRVGSLYQLGSFNLVDLTGNQQQGFGVDFTTAFSANTNAPAVVNTSPENTESQVPTNSPVEILFSEPIQPTSIGGVSLTQGANVIATTASFTNANQTLTLSPGSLLSPNTTYTITVTGVKDTAGNTMSGTVTNTFTTGATFDVVQPTVVSWDPANGTIGVGTNVNPKVHFSERINPLTINSNSFQFYEYYTGLRIAATASISADRLTATLTPSAALAVNTTFYVTIGCSANYTDVAGNNGQCSVETFVTGGGSDTGATTVSTISPANAQTGAPLNAQIVAVMSDDIDPTRVTNNSITVTPSGGSAIAGTVSLAADGVTLTFTPAAALNASTLYNISVGGFVDTEGNAVTTFTSSFTTGTTSFGTGSFGIVSTSPTNGATGVSVTSPVTFTMTNLINPASVNPTTVEVYVYNTNTIVAGTYTVTGNSVKFTPSTQYPASTQMGMYILGLTDEAGNPSNQFGGTFTTTNTVDTTPPTVTISPANGANNVGFDTQVVLTFSKSINPATVNSSSVNLLNGDTPLNPSVAISANNRTVILNSGSGPLPAGATITVTATHLVQDLSGNPLADTTSKFTVAPPVSTSNPYVINMRPGNGASDVPTSTVITLFTSAPMNQSSLSSALHVSQNGVLVSGTTNIASNGQSIEFTPSSALAAGTVTQVFLDSTAQDIYGNPLQYFSAQFTTQGSLTNTASQVIAVNPFPGATAVPLNTVLQVQYDQQLNSGTITCSGSSGSVTLYQYSSGTYLNPNCSLVGGGQVINVAPASNLVASSQYSLCVSGTVTNIDGIAVQSYCTSFTAGTVTDTVAPTITAQAPPDTATNIGTNAGVIVTFNKAINPVSVNGSTVKLSAGATVEMPSSILFNSTYNRATIIPQTQLPSSTSMTVTINGVTSEAGVAVASQTTHFTTIAGPEFAPPSVVHASVDNNQTVGTNAALAMQFGEPMDPGSYNPNNVYIYDYNLATIVTATASFSTDLTTVMLKPSANLGASHQFAMCSSNMVDLEGNPQNGFCVGFFTGGGTDTTGPVVQQVSPPASSTAVPTNAIVQVLFNKQISGVSLGGVQLTVSSVPVPTTATLYDGDMGVQLTPLVPLNPGTVYTINVAGVQDITGNTQSSFTPTTFTTGTGTDLVPGSVVSTNPTSGQTSVAVTTSVQVNFSKAMDPASFDVNNSFTLRDPSNNVVSATITFSNGYKTATLKPKSSLTSATTYNMYIGAVSALKDWAGNNLNAYVFSFTTQ